MINTDDFAKRLKKVIDYYGESASSFAEKISVQRSSISHILSGRNKPSLEFVLKILTAFPEVELYWLLNGKGEFPSTPNQYKIFDDAKPHNLKLEENAAPIQNLESDTNPSVKTKSEKKIERIVIFYSDGSFKNFQNS